MAISAKNIHYTFPGSSAPILSGFGIDVSDQEVCAIIGPNGCGKSTLLRILAGILVPALKEDGEAASLVISGNGHNLHETGLAAWQSSLAGHSTLVFQNYGDVVFPWQRVDKALRWIDAGSTDYYNSTVSLFRMLDGPILNRKFWGDLSGGQKQAVAVARGLLRNADLLLLDEPFSAIDAWYRYKLELAVIQSARYSKSHRSTLLVTHDIDEAVFLADRIIVVAGPPLCIKREIRVGESSRERTNAFRLSAAFAKAKAELVDEIFRN